MCSWLVFVGSIAQSGVSSLLLSVSRYPRKWVTIPCLDTISKPTSNKKTCQILYNIQTMSSSNFFQWSSVIAWIESCDIWKNICKQGSTTPDLLRKHSGQIGFKGSKTTTLHEVRCCLQCTLQTSQQTSQTSQAKTIQTPISIKQHSTFWFRQKQKQFNTTKHCSSFCPLNRNKIGKLKPPKLWFA